MDTITTFLMNCFYGNIEYVQEYLKSNPDLIDCVDLGNFSGLLYATLNNKQNMITLLIEKGANPFLVSSNKDCAVSYPNVVYEIMFKKIRDAYNDFDENVKLRFDLSRDPLVNLIQKSDARTKCPDFFFLLMNPWATVLQFNDFMNHYICPTKYPIEYDIILLPRITLNKTMVHLLYHRFQHIYQVWELCYKPVIEKINKVLLRCNPENQPIIFKHDVSLILKKHLDIYC